MLYEIIIGIKFVLFDVKVRVCFFFLLYLYFFIFLYVFKWIESSVDLVYKLSIENFFEFGRKICMIVLYEMCKMFLVFCCSDVIKMGNFFCVLLVYILDELM